MTVPYHSPPSSSSTPSASSSNSRLQPFLLLAQSTRPRGAAAAKLVQQVTEASGVYGFGELLSIPGVPELQDSEHSASFRLFKLFAYGTLSDYKRSPQDYPPLSDAQLEKLRRLSLVSLAMDRRVLAYDLLFEELDIPSRQIRELEDLIIDATYDGLVSGRMDQIQSCFQVESVVGRDVIEDEQLEELFNKLDDWSKTTDSVIHSLNSRIESTKQADQISSQSRLEHNQELYRNLSQVQSNPTGGGGGGGKNPSNLAWFGGGENNRMELDQETNVEDPSNPPSLGSGRGGHRKKGTSNASQNQRAKRSRA